jgi:hypothetical protein
MCLAESPVGTLIMNYVHGGCEVRFAPGVAAMDMALDFLNGGEAHVLRVHTEKSPGMYYRGAIYCVSLTKSFLGLRGCRAVTPWGLHSWLKRSNLRVLDLNEAVGRGTYGWATKAASGSGSEKAPAGRGGSR